MENKFHNIFQLKIFPIMHHYDLIVLLLTTAYKALPLQFFIPQNCGDLKTPWKPSSTACIKYAKQDNIAIYTIYNSLYNLFHLHLKKATIFSEFMQIKNIRCILFPLKQKMYLDPKAVYKILYSQFLSIFVNGRIW